MSLLYDNWIPVTHRWTAWLVRSGNRLFLAILLLGSLFGAFTMGLWQVLQKPEQALQIQGFLYNLAEFDQAGQGQSGPPQPQKSRQANRLDPSWDGALAGAGLGWSVGQSVPVIGSIAGSLLGAVVCYQLDERI